MSAGQDDDRGAAAAAAAAGESLPPGSVLGRYELRRPLGRGGMGAVYEAVHRELKKRVALKVLAPALAGNKEARLRFLREGEAASRIRHPHVVDVTDVGSDGAFTYLVMELLEGEDLAARIARGGALPVADAAGILLPVCAGVAAAHDVGVVHRDLKPENIFLARGAHGGGVHPKVLDFGVSKVAGGSGSALALTGTAATFGTPYYIPPEQLAGARQADHRSDQYALGVVLYECVTGRRPFEGDNVYAILRAIGDGDYRPPRAVRPQLPEAVDALIVRAMSREPPARFPSVRHLARALLPFASPSAQIIWADSFAVPDEPAPMVRGSTLPMPAALDGPADAAAETAPVDPALPPGSVSGTQILPPAPATTTLGSTAGESLRRARPTPVSPPARSSRAPLIIAAGTVVVALGIGVAIFASRSPPPKPPEVAAAPPRPMPAAPAPDPAPAPAPAPATFHIDLRVEPPTATLELDGTPAGTGSLTRTLPLDGTDHHLVAHAPGFTHADLHFRDAPPPPLLTLRPVPSPADHDRAPTAKRPPTPKKPTRGNGAPILGL